MSAAHPECQPDNPEVRQHTPLPWRAHRDVIISDTPSGEYQTTAVAYYGDEIRHSGGLPFGSERDANATLIVEAVNNYKRERDEAASYHKFWIEERAKVATLQARVEDLTKALRDVLDSGALSAMEGCTCETCAPIARARALVPSLEDRK